MKTQETLVISDHIKGEMGRTCSMYGEQEKSIQGFCGKNLKKNASWKKLGVGWRVILKWILNLICLIIGQQSRLLTVPKTYLNCPKKAAHRVICLAM